MDVETKKRGIFISRFSIFFRNNSTKKHFLIFLSKIIHWPNILNNPYVSMIASDILTAIILGFTAGLSPGPIILLAFSEILRSPKEGLKNWGKYLMIAGVTEFFIGLFLIVSASYFQIPQIILHILSLFWGGLLLFIAYQVFQIRTIKYEDGTKGKSVESWKVALFVILNGPLWLFWISVCVPVAFRLESQIYGGALLFIFIFEISMVVGLACILFGFHSFRSFFSKESVVHTIFTILSGILVLLAIKILYPEILFMLYG